jgi:capsular polysaccharide biosynthesis protein
MDLLSYYEVIKSRWRVVLVAFLITLITTIVLTFLQNPIYEAMNSFVLRPRSSVIRENADFVRVLDTLSNRVEINATIVEVARSDLIKNLAAERLGISSSEKRELDVDARIIPGTNAVEISVQGTSPEGVKEFVDAISIETGIYVLDLYNLFQLDLLDDSVVPNSPVGPNRILNIILGMTFGLILGVGLAFVADYYNFPHERIKPFDIIDHDTGAYNKDYFMTRIDQEIGRVKSNEGTFALSLLKFRDSSSVIFFKNRKSIKFLRAFVVKVNDALHDQGILARYDDHFLTLLLPGYHQQQAIDYINEMLSEIMDNLNDEVMDGDEIIHCFHGVTSYQDPQLVKEDLFVQAEHELNKISKRQ